MTMATSTTTTTGQTGDQSAGSGAGPVVVPVPAPLIAEVVELLAVGDELIAMRPSCCVSMRLLDLLRPLSVGDVYDTFIRLRASFGLTATELAVELTRAGIDPSPVHLPTHAGRISHQ